MRDSSGREVGSTASIAREPLASSSIFGDMRNDADLVSLLTPSTETSPEDRLYELANTISNIVSSYDDPYDAFAELLQNALDAVAERSTRGEKDYVPRVQVSVDRSNRTLSVEDNGTGIAWQDHQAAVRPNYSLKRRLGQSTSRGEKGAALTFLQFGGAEFSLSSRSGGEQGWSYTLSDGRDWFEETVKLLEDGRVFDDKLGEFPVSSFSLGPLDEKDTLTQGTRASVKFIDDRLTDLLGEDYKVAFSRLEYLLRTRTGLGFMVPDDDRDRLEEWQKSLVVSITLDADDDALTPGFLYPHELAKRSGSRKASMLTSPTANSELMYDHFDKAWLKRYVPKVVGNPKHAEVIDRFDVTGYVAYAFKNDWYEEVTQQHLSLPEDAGDSSLSETLIQVNGGFLVAVKDFPTGRRKAFLHRSGAEHKSRTFVCVNLAGDYKPDYGRKNLASDAHAFVLDLCKELIAFASGKKSNLYRGTAQSTHSAKNAADALESLKEDAVRLTKRGVLLVSGEPDLRRAPATETEVVAEFLRLVAIDSLPGFHVYGLLARGMLDGYFDYTLIDKAHAFDELDRPLGVAFADGQPMKYRGQWMEFKITSDGLTDDFDRDPGQPGKKYFGQVDLLVCESVDSATDNYDILEVTSDNYEERKYYGVTHILRSATNNDHAVQVICLRSLRATIAAQVGGSPLTPVEPVEGE
ncbi:ATP-binding protein [Agromyces ramosus]|nr:ATP-binding protein [Agromyces ramosus]